MFQKFKGKKIRELLEFYHSLPQGRWIVGYVGAVGLVLLSIAFGFAVYFKAGFIAYLTLGFLICLSTFHSHYALAQNLTQRKVRTIDYWYLGAAAIGLLLFAAGYSNQRQATIARMLVKVHEAGESTKRSDVSSALNTLSEFLCEYFIFRSKAPCDGVKKVAMEIRPNLSAKDISILQERFEKDVAVPYGLAFTVEEIVRNQNVFLRLSVVQVRMDDWRQYAEGAPKTISTVEKIDDDAEILFGLGQWVVWPFLLAYALALRITKVTIDVFEWAE